MNTELQQKHREKRKLKREIIKQLSMNLKPKIGLVLFSGVIVLTNLSSRNP